MTSGDDDRAEWPAAEEGGAPPHEVAEYIADLSAQLATLARSRDFELIAYLLEMAKMEAANTVRRLVAPS